MNPKRHMILVMSVLLATFVLIGAASPPESSSDDEVFSELVHSDLPLFDDKTEQMWPQSFYDGDSIGCVSKVASGDWVMHENGGNTSDISEWYRIDTRAAFECSTAFARADDRADLDEATSRPSFFILLETTALGGTDVELWVAQIGARPGSDYLLLSRPKAEGIVKSFTALQAQCPKAHLRKGPSLHGFITHYCSINSQADLQRLARRMVQRPPLGTLTFVENSDDGDGPTEKSD